MLPIRITTPDATPASIAARSTPGPGSTVVGPDAFGSPSHVGASINWAREDHDHGLPGGVGGYASLTGLGQSTSPGGLEQQGGMDIEASTAGNTVGPGSSFGFFVNETFGGFGIQTSHSGSISTGGPSGAGDTLRMTSLASISLEPVDTVDMIFDQTPFPFQGVVMSTGGIGASAGTTGDMLQFGLNGTGGSGFGLTIQDTATSAPNGIHILSFSSLSLSSSTFNIAGSGATISSPGFAGYDLALLDSGSGILIEATAGGSVVLNSQSNVVAIQTPGPGVEMSVGGTQVEFGSTVTGYALDLHDTTPSGGSSNRGIRIISDNGPVDLQSGGSFNVTVLSPLHADAIFVAASTVGLCTGGPSNSLGFFSSSAVPRQTVTGSRAGGGALFSLLAALSAYGLILDTTTP